MKTIKIVITCTSLLFVLYLSFKNTNYLNTIKPIKVIEKRKSSIYFVKGILLESDTVNTICTTNDIYDELQVGHYYIVETKFNIFLKDTLRITRVMR